MLVTNVTMRVIIVELAQLAEGNDWRSLIRGRCRLSVVDSQYYSCIVV